MNFSDVIDKISKLNDDEKIVFHCKGEKLADKFIDNCYIYSNIAGITLNNIEIFKDDTQYDSYKNETCYCIEKRRDNKYCITYSGMDYFIDENYAIYEYDYDQFIDIQQLLKNNTNNKDNQMEEKLNLISKQYDDILVSLKQLSDKLDNLQFTL